MRTMPLARLALPIFCLALTTCCPTLWIQVTKTAPAPWPEMPTPQATAPRVPAAMPNRFDVLAGKPGTLTRFADGYRDAIDEGDDALAQRTRALDALELMLTTYGDSRLTACTSSSAATVRCTQRNKGGASANCNALLVETRPSPGGLAIIKSRNQSQSRIIEAVDTDPETGKPIVALTERIDATDGDFVDVCYVDEVVLSKPLLSFVHLSDIQLRDPSVVLTDRTLSHHLDWFQPLSSFEYDEDMAFYNQYLVEAMVATINAAAARTGPASDPEKPSFVIHTGDSIDSNMLSELVRFHTVIDRLKIPFFDLFGNHDLLVFGNLTPTDTHDSDGQCTPVASLVGHQTRLAPDKICVDKLVKRCPTCVGDDIQLVASTAGHVETRQRFMATLAHLPSEPVAEPIAAPHELVGDYCGDTKPRVVKVAYSRDHGFDLGTKSDRLDGERLGYYAFAQKLAPGDDADTRHAVFIALDSEELADHQGGVGGRVGHEQLAWLQRVLGCVRQPKHVHDLVFVFAHQPLSLIDVDEVDSKMNVATTLAESPNVVAYLYGHNHAHSICGDERAGVCTKFWEVETGSLIEFPQEGRLVRLKQVGQKLAFLELSTFSEQLADASSELARYVSLARRGAERDHCVTATDAHCSADQRPYRVDGDSTAARLFFKLP